MIEERGETRVRRGVAADLAGVLELERRVTEAPHWNEAEYWKAVEEPSAGADEHNLRRALWVAVSGERVVGFAVARVCGEESELESVAVDPEWQRRGLAKTLCAALLEWCRARGAGVTELEVREGSEGAVRLYRELGFVVVGRRRGYYGAPAEDALLMRLKLGQGFWKQSNADRGLEG